MAFLTGPNRLKTIRYLALIYIPILLIAAFMPTVGTHLWFALLPQPSFNSLDLILPSCLTWLLLAPLLVNRSAVVTASIGGLSPLFGAAFVLLLGIGPVADIRVDVRGYLGGMLYAVVYIKTTAVVTLPVGIATAFLVRGIFSRWPPPK